MDRPHRESRAAAQHRWPGRGRQDPRPRVRRHRGPGPIPGM